MLSVNFCVSVRSLCMSKLLCVQLDIVDLLKPKKNKKTKYATGGVLYLKVISISTIFTKHICRLTLPLS